VWLLQGSHGVTSQKTPFFIVTAVKTSNLIICVSIKKIALWAGGVIMEAALFFDTSIKVCQAARRHIPDENTLYNNISEKFGLASVMRLYEQY
jgi:hypothetical protein